MKGNEFSTTLSQLAGYYLKGLEQVRSVAIGYAVNLLRGKTHAYVDLALLCDREPLMTTPDGVISLKPPKTRLSRVAVELVETDEVDELTEVEAAPDSDQVTAFARLCDLYQRHELNPYDREFLYGYPMLVGTLKDTRIFGPIWTVRCQVERDLTEGTVRLELTGDPEINMHLFRKVLSEAQLTLFQREILAQSEWALPMEANEMQIFFQRLANAFPEIIAPVEGWVMELRRIADAAAQVRMRGGLFAEGELLRVEPCAALIFAARPQYYLRSDLEELQSIGDVNGSVIAALFENAEGKVNAPDESEEYQVPPLEELIFPFKSNEAQRKVAQAVERHQVIYVWGPPGTGKSETICNLICHLVAKGKTVLVSSQKPKALEVVTARLDRLGVDYLHMTLLKGDKKVREELTQKLGRLDAFLAQHSLDKLQERERQLLEGLNWWKQQTLQKRQQFEMQREAERRMEGIYRRYYELRADDVLPRDILLPDGNDAQLADALARYGTLYAACKDVWAELDLWATEEQRLSDEGFVKQLVVQLDEALDAAYSAAQLLCRPAICDWAKRLSSRLRLNSINDLSLSPDVFENLLASLQAVQKAVATTFELADEARQCFPDGETLTSWAHRLALTTFPDRPWENAEMLELVHDFANYYAACYTEWQQLTKWAEREPMAKDPAFVQKLAEGLNQLLPLVQSVSERLRQPDIVALVRQWDDDSRFPTDPHTLERLTQAVQSLSEPTRQALLGVERLRQNYPDADTLLAHARSLCALTPEDCERLRQQLHQLRQLGERLCETRWALDGITGTSESEEVQRAVMDYSETAPHWWKRLLPRHRRSRAILRQFFGTPRGDKFSEERLKQAQTWVEHQKAHRDARILISQLPAPCEPSVLSELLNTGDLLAWWSQQRRFNDLFAQVEAERALQQALQALPYPILTRADFERWGSWKEAEKQLNILRAALEVFQRRQQCLSDKALNSEVAQRLPSAFARLQEALQSLNSEEIATAVSEALPFINALPTFAKLQEFSNSALKDCPLLIEWAQEEIKRAREVPEDWLERAKFLFKLASSESAVEQALRKLPDAVISRSDWEIRGDPQKALQVLETIRDSLTALWRRQIAFQELFHAGSLPTTFLWLRGALLANDVEQIFSCIDSGRNLLAKLPTFSEALRLRQSFPDSLRLTTWIHQQVDSNGSVPEGFAEKIKLALEAYRLRHIIEQDESVQSESTDQLAEFFTERAQRIPDVVKELLQVRILLRLKENYHRLRQDIALLRRLLRSGKKSYRRFEELKQQVNFNALLQLFPCWIMTLDEVARVFPLQAGLFDVLIVDEATQCFLPTALPALYRAKKVVIVGDEKQLASAEAMFLAEAVNDELKRQFGIDGLPRALAFDMRSSSLVDMADILCDKKIALNEHFRSLLEIIRFANECFYGFLRIMTQGHDSPPDGVFEVRLVEGGYEDEKRGINPLEAKALVDDLFQRLRDPRYDGLSFGVLSLFREQADYIQRLIMERLWEEPELQTFLQNRPEPLLASTVDGFQGDERDVIFFSFRYASNSHPGSIYAIQNDQRRINVAVTRARKKVIAYISRPVSEFPRGLVHDFLAYLQDPSVGTKPEGEQFDSPFEQDVCERLRKHGFRVFPQYPACGYRIDLVVEDPQTGKRLAVECDGERYHTDETGYPTADDLVRQEVLERAGWRVIRIPSRRYWRDPEGCIDWVITALRGSGDMLTGLRTGENKPSISPTPSQRSDERKPFCH